MFDATLGWYRTRARIDLDTDVVPTSDDISGSAYLVDRVWVARVWVIRVRMNGVRMNGVLLDRVVAACADICSRLKLAPAIESDDHSSLAPPRSAALGRRPCERLWWAAPRRSDHQDTNNHQDRPGDPHWIRPTRCLQYPEMIE